MLRPPQSEDGSSVHRLISQCSPLSTNSMYCNLLQCTHFAGTSVAAKVDDQLVGFISGYLIPDRENTLFIWQVAVSEKARGQGLATKMLKDILARPQCDKVTHIETTITELNKASWSLFKGLAEKLKVDIKRSVFFDHVEHFNRTDDTEMLARIGPF